MLQKNMEEIELNQIYHEFLETLKSVDGEVKNIEYHQKRYESVLNAISGEEKKDLISYLHPPKKGLYRCRLIYTADSTTVTYHKYEQREVSSLKLVYDDTIDYSFKYLNRGHIDKLFSLKEEADDILIVKNSLVTDTSIANVAFYKEGVWFTPRLPLLKGTTRARLLDEGKIIEADIRVDELASFSKVALLNAMIDFNLLDQCEFLL